MITDYASLQSAIADYLGRSDLTTQIQTFINQGEARIYRSLRVADMEKSLTGSLANNTLAVPSDYQHMKELYISTSDGFQPLERADLWWLRGHYPTQTAQSAPIYYAREGQNFIFAPYPDSNYTVGGVYFARLPSLSVTNTTNWLTAKNPDLIMAAALLEASTYLDDQPGVQYWTQRYGEISQDVQQSDKLERFSGSPLMIRVG